MELITLGLLILFASLIYIFSARKSSFKKDDNKVQPPLQSGLPLLGYTPFLRPNRYVAFTKLHEKYGPIFRISIFNRKMLVIGGIDILREALVEKGEIFAARPNFRYLNMMTDGKGIILQDGADMQIHRRFILKSLRDLGFAKTLSLDAIHNEVQTFMDFVDSNGGEEIKTKFIFSKMTNNVICHLVFGQQIGKQGNSFETLFNHVSKLMEIDNRIYENFPLYFPFLVDYPIIMKIYERFAWRRTVFSSIREFIYTKLHEEAANITISSEPQSLMEALLLHQQSLESDEKSKHTLDNSSIVADVFDLFVAGTDTTAASLTWAMALLSVNPGIQTQVREEIRNQIGLEKLPTMQDRSNLNYTLAVIDEIARFGTIAPTALLHSTTQDTTLRGYHIPEGTHVIPNLYAIHRDPKLWRSPFNFDPNNFLDGNGKYRPSENLVPFSLGKRSCLGESLARMEMFIFFVAVLQRYEISLPECYQSDTESLLQGDDGLVRHLKDHGIILKRVID